MDFYPKLTLQKTSVSPKYKYLVGYLRFCDSMIRAYVLVNTAIGKEMDAAELIRTITGVTSVDLVYGQYPMVVELESNTADEAKNIVKDKIRRVGYVRSTLTMLCPGSKYDFSR